MKTKLFSKAVQLVTALSIAVSILPVGMLTVSAAEDKVVEHDWVLESDGKVRDGVKLTAQYTRRYADGVTPDEDVLYTDGALAGANGQIPLTSVLTISDVADGNQGWFIGWNSEKDENENTIWSSVKGSYYFQLDLGAVRNINEIGFSPYIGGGEYHDYVRIYLSNDPTFTTGVYEVTNGSTKFAEKQLTKITYSTEETKSYRYVRFRNSCENGNEPFLSAKKITVKGKEVFSETDLLHDSDGELTATFTSGRPGYKDIPKLQNINSIADGKYDIQYKDDGQLDLEKATSFVMNFGKGDQWIQADLGEKKAITSVKALLYPGTVKQDTYFKRDVEIQVSNNPSFETYKTLAKTDSTFVENTDEARNKWLEYNDETASNEYRYVRIASPYDSLGVTELKINGYALCSENKVLYTNFDNALMDSESDTSRIKVSNFQNADKHFMGWRNFSYAMPVTERLQIVLDGDVDAQTVNSSNLVVKNTFVQGGQSKTSTINCKTEVKGDTIYIDPYNFESEATVTIELKAGIKAGGKKLAGQTLMFKTGAIAPLEYEAGKTVKNVAAGKNVWDSTDYSERKIVTASEQGAGVLTDGHLDVNTATNLSNLVIDLGSEYEIAAYSIATQNRQWAWHTSAYSVYMSDSWDSLMSEENLVAAKGEQLYDKRPCGNKKLAAPKKTRFVTLSQGTDTGNGISEFEAYAYVPTTSETGVADAYYKYNNSTGKCMFTIEKDNAALANKVVIARYDGEKLVDVTMTAENTVKFDIGANSAGTPYTAKAFVIDGVNGLKPLTTSVVY